MMELTKEEQIQAIYDLKVGYTLGPADIAILKAMARQLLASMEQEPIILYRERNPVTGMTTGWVELTQEEYGFIKDHSSEDADFKRVYAAPQLPQPAMMPPNYSRFLSDVMTAAGFLSHGKRDKGLATRLADFCVAERMGMDAPCRTAMLQGADPSADNTNQQFESLSRGDK